MKYSVNEVKLGLEICGGEGMECAQCPFRDAAKSCSHELMAAARDIITNQEMVIARAQEACEAAQRAAIVRFIEELDCTASDWNELTEDDIDAAYDAAIRR